MKRKLAVAPSPDYVALMTGKITPDEYVRRLKIDAPRRRLRNLLRFRT